MKIQLIKNLTHKIPTKSIFEVRKLTLDGIELQNTLNDYLSKFTIGIMDPDINGKNPEKFIINLSKNLLGDFSKRYILVAYDNDNPVGVLIGLPNNEQQLHIYSLHIAVEYRHKGIGSLLLSKCINDMYSKNVQSIILDVHMNNIPAYNLYKKFGFIEVNKND